MPKGKHPEDGGFFRRFADFGAMPRHLTRWQQVMKSAVSLTSLQERRERVKEFELSTPTETSLRSTRVGDKGDRQNRILDWLGRPASLENQKSFPRYRTIVRL